MKAPKLLKNESISSFRTRVSAWEKRTGKKYPKSGLGTREERALSNRVLLGTFGKSIDYSKDYNLDDEAKELSLDPSNSKKWRESKEGKAFAKQELMIQQNIDDAVKEQSTLDAYTNTYDDIDTAEVEDLTAQIYEKKKKKKKDNIPEEDVTSDKEDETSFKNQASGDKPKDERAEWLHKTRNSPAAKAGFSDDQRWKLQDDHRKWKKNRKNKKKLSIKD